MKYYSTNKKAPMASLREAVEHGLAPDRGLYMPETINRLPNTFFEKIDHLSFQEIALAVARSFLGISGGSSFSASKSTFPSIFFSFL